MSTETKTEKKTSLFDKAKGKTATTSKKETHPVIVLAENKYEGISEKLKRVQELRDSMKEQEAELKMIEGEVRTIGKTEFLNLYENGKRNPDSIKLKGEKGGCVMFITMDRYLMLDEQRAEQIKNSYGADLVDEVTVFSFNNDVLERNKKAIEKMFDESTEISQADKDNLFVGKTTYSIKKGTIDTLYQKFASKLREVFEAIAPVTQIKNCKE